MHKPHAFAALILMIGAGAMAQPNSGVRLAEDQAAYLTRCRTETIARFPTARAQADSICQSRWSEVIAAGPMADAIITATPREGAAFDPASVRTALPQVRWAGTPTQGTVASGRLNDIYVAATRTPAPGLTINWSKEGEPIPFNLADAVRVRGGALTMIGCLSFGGSEQTTVYQVRVPGKSPFALTIAARNAAVASQSSDYSVSADFSGRMPSLATLRRDGSEWQATCPL